jgi:hypothetical protein
MSAERDRIPIQPVENPIPCSPYGERSDPKAHLEGASSGRCARQVVNRLREMSCGYCRF